MYIDSGWLRTRVAGGETEEGEHDDQHDQLELLVVAVREERDEREEREGHEDQPPEPMPDQEVPAGEHEDEHGPERDHQADGIVRDHRDCEPHEEERRDQRADRRELRPAM
jgi:hypothetical protein